METHQSSIDFTSKMYDLSSLHDRCESACPTRSLAQALEGYARTVLIKPFSEEILVNAINSVEIFGLGHPIPKYY